MAVTFAGDDGPETFFTAVIVQVHMLGVLMREREGCVAGAAGETLVMV